MENATVITGPNIEKYRLATIEIGLKLESKGMRHSTNAVATAARDILTKAGEKPARNKAALYEQFKAWRAKQTA